ncbi:hypothetical protein SDRG_02626 [Saprolegnia diclina VS20]|uniref:Uncharacterized protein n=1 Tax=Saprolegnia diclina (strain VS20) TaxID=1156394 RepID=T0QZ67_SAPDV|nr:hypothetical protein SDRG_02626 [Saprolegnia diclina VS20]EQC39971.1 hypothetical protein SDRG_02626 [Saprolegnia diclina VS20]|eukprot:XP_008606445.1 hypothetical protein SDRG_02626 [Saprolegnia diclina VS20]
MHNSKRPRVEMTASFRCLVDANLVAAMTSFQCGLYDDLRPRFAKWRASSAPPRDLSFRDLCVRDGSDRRVVLHEAIARGELDIVKRLEACQLDLFSPSAMDCAARHGQRAIVAYLHTAGYACTSDAMDQAATHGHLPVVAYLDTHRHEGCSLQAMVGAAENGHLFVIEYLHKHRDEGCSVRAMDYAARNGHIDVVRFLHTHRNEGCSAIALDFAAAHGHLAIVEFLHNERTEGCSTYAMDGAARNGHLAVVQFLHTYRHEGCSRKAAVQASRMGHSAIATFLKANYSVDALPSAPRKLRGKMPKRPLVRLLPPAVSRRL